MGDFLIKQNKDDLSHTWRRNRADDAAKHMKTIQIISSMEIKITITYLLVKCIFGYLGIWNCTICLPNNNNYFSLLLILWDKTNVSILYLLSTIFFKNIDTCWFHLLQSWACAQFCAITPTATSLLKISWSFCIKSHKYIVASTQAVTGLVFMPRFRLILGWNKF